MVLAVHGQLDKKGIIISRTWCYQELKGPILLIADLKRQMYVFYWQDFINKLLLRVVDIESI